MKRLLLLWLFVYTAAAAEGSGGVNAPEHRDKPYLVLVSIDGFRWDYQDLYDTPTLDRIAASGVRAERMIPVFPTLTFPNHYSIATGLYPKNHRLIGNTFPSKDLESWYTLRDRDAVQDGAWYSGEPVWVAAEKAGIVTAAFFFVGTEADVSGIPMTYWNAFDASIPGAARVDQVLDWLAMPAEGRPHLVTLYFEDVDTDSHRFGPDSPESIAAIERVDGYLDRLLRGIDALPIADDIYLVIVSDHGQLARRTDVEPFIIADVVDIEGVAIVDHGTSAFVYLDASQKHRAVEIRDAINDAWDHGKAMLRDETPESWHVTQDAGFADVIVQAEPTYLVHSTGERAKFASLGDHGWARDVEGMHGIFLASGPRLPEGERIGAIEATDIYPLLMGILGLPITTPIDGAPEKLEYLLAP